MVSTATDVKVKTTEGCSRKRVLLLAYACSPYRGSEAGVGWNRAIETAKYFDTWVIVKEGKNAPEINKWIAENGEIRGLHFCYLPRTRFEVFLRRVFGLWYLTYHLWHRRAYRLAVKLHVKFQFHIVHQITFCGFREPGYLWKLKVPFVWGPVAGTNNYPWPFLRSAGIRGALIEGVRSVVNLLQFRFSSRVRKASKQAAVLLTVNSEGRDHFKMVHKINPILELDVGSSAVLPRPLGNIRDRCHPLRILWSGALRHHKALHLLILALSGLPPSLRYELRILGEGPLKKRWNNLAIRTGVEANCTWLGWLPHSEAMAQFQWADVFVFTSLRDACGTVVMEAISHGVPIICFDHQGVGDVIMKDCGIKIGLTGFDDAVRKLRAAIINIAQDRAKLSDLGKAAGDRARDYLWSVKGEKMAKIYTDILAGGRPSD